MERHAPIVRSIYRGLAAEFDPDDDNDQHDDDDKLNILNFKLDDNNDSASILWDMRFFVR